MQDIQNECRLKIEVLSTETPDHLIQKYKIRFEIFYVFLIKKEKGFTANFECFVRQIS